MFSFNSESPANCLDSSAPTARPFMHVPPRSYLRRTQANHEVMGFSLASNLWHGRQAGSMVNPDWKEIDVAPSASLSDAMRAEGGESTLNSQGVGPRRYGRLKPLPLSEIGDIVSSSNHRFNQGGGIVG